MKPQRSSYPNTQTAAIVLAAIGVAAVMARPAVHRLRRLYSASSTIRTWEPTAGPETTGGWRKYTGNPVLGGSLGITFDACVRKDQGQFKMWFSWRTHHSIGYATSSDGMHWSQPTEALTPNPDSGWGEADVNRPCVLKRGDRWMMWYTGQAVYSSAIGLAVSQDAVNWTRVGTYAVLQADKVWEKRAVMCPDVLWDDSRRLFQMWYSAGDQFEPDAIGYATSVDGLHWQKRAHNPIFQADPHSSWEQDKVTACDVVRDRGQYLMFYIGFKDVHRASIGLARSPDGVSHWQRDAENPIIGPGKLESAWDADAVCKPAVIHDANTWYLWYSGRREGVEQVGLAVHKGDDVWPSARSSAQR